MIKKAWIVFFDENDKIISERYLHRIPKNINRKKVVKDLVRVYLEAYSKANGIDAKKYFTKKIRSVDNSFDI